MQCEENITAACKRLLQQQSFSTQDDIRKGLIDLGFVDVSQSTVSRLLTRLGVAKVPNPYGKKVYCLTLENEQVQVDSAVSSQIEFVSNNQLVVVIKTHPGSAQLVARIIDMQPHKEILGTVGGNDTVMVAPRDITRIDECEKIVRSRLGLS
ncbi:arginine repressor [Vibrio sp. JC009]|uniref:arginine repressor n=1 Tax=Vibrio sp. JC009 TaxID=2912314 RepID=UPI0023B17A24|nr:arginine repressor [Vibrio sp. JC009]WED23320.1 arginine repressor [Vibrio sp. JC009]